MNCRRKNKMWIRWVAVLAGLVWFAGLVGCAKPGNLFGVTQPGETPANQSSVSPYLSEPAATTWKTGTTSTAATATAPLPSTAAPIPTITSAVPTTAPPVPTTTAPAATTATPVTTTKAPAPTIPAPVVTTTAPAATTAAPVTTTPASVPTTTAATTTATTSAIQTTTASTTAPAGTLTEAEWIDRIFVLTNDVRASHGLPLFAKGSEASLSAAYVRSREIVTYFSHTRPDDRLWYTAFADAGVNYSWAGENIAAGYHSPESVVEAWMNSPGHAANILKPEFTHLAVGFCYAPTELYRDYAVQLFYTPAG